MSTAGNLIDRNKPFTCTVCGKTFQDKMTLDAHKEKDHSVSGEPSGYEGKNF